jgi:hypothetical protein
VKEQHLPLGQGPHDKFYQAQKKFWNFNALILRIHQLF